LTPPVDRRLGLRAHFYRPRRQSPWLEPVEVQNSAYPYHHWNERITAECYARDAASRILNGDGRIRTIVNNRLKIRLNFGPALPSWIEEESLALHSSIPETDRQTVAQRSGNGSAHQSSEQEPLAELARLCRTRPLASVSGAILERLERILRGTPGFLRGGPRIARSRCQMARVVRASRKQALVLERVRVV
jgi:hypothetical protein